MNASPATFIAIPTPGTSQMSGGGDDTSGPIVFGAVTNKAITKASSAIATNRIRVA